MARKDRSTLRRADATRHIPDDDGETTVLQDTQPAPHRRQADYRQHEYQQHPSVPPEVPERVVATLRPHARVLFFPCLTLILLAGAAGYFGESFPEGWQRTAFYGAVALGVLLFWLLPLLIWLSRRCTITTRRLIVRRGFFVRVRQELLHSRGYDISLSRGPVQSVFRSGDIRINTGLEAPVLLRDVPSATLVTRALQDLMEAGADPMTARRQQEDSIGTRGTHPSAQGWR
ncbi:PH domain-containing protein [Planctomonas psychrotolerans]|uniref:PH domain-containing protein n=1 Tax=Planctomonas psychrotolerans TaxID=2528712 RepID=UPI0012398995|nr:PH domain-containing protein [Planctomonas psychrotolerans]